MNKKEPPAAMKGTRKRRMSMFSPCISSDNFFLFNISQPEEMHCSFSSGKNVSLMHLDNRLKHVRLLTEQVKLTVSSVFQQVSVRNESLLRKMSWLDAVRNRYRWIMDGFRENAGRGTTDEIFPSRKWEGGRRTDDSALSTGNWSGKEEGVKERQVDLCQT